jgi:hypothetical protein
LTQTPEEKREAAAIRRRWVTLGEVVAVLAVLISAATLWNSYQERKSSEAERAAAAQKETRAETALVLRARPEADGKRLALEPVDSEQVIQSQQVVFPSKLGVKRIETAGDARIEARWIAGALEDLKTRPSGAGDLRVPVAIVSRFTSKDAVRTSAALYQLTYKRDDGLLGSSIRLRGLSLVERLPAARAQAAADLSFNR